ncbi:MAG: hypothetical protein ACODAA_09315, partial [Gemmatimonadota bacterium]
FALGMWDDVARMNERSWRASIERAERQELGPGAYSYHALWWLHYAHLQRGRMDEAGRFLDVAREALAESGAGTIRYHLQQMRAAHIVADPAGAVDAGLADAALADTTGGDYARAANLLAAGLALARAGRVTRAERATALLRDVAGDGSDDVLRVSETLLRGALLVEAGEQEEGLALLRDAATAEASIPYQFGPPLIVKPASELLGEALLAADDREGARAAFERALERAPGRALSVRGLAAAGGGP